MNKSDEVLEMSKWLIALNTSRVEPTVFTMAGIQRSAAQRHNRSQDLPFLLCLLVYVAFVYRGERRLDLPQSTRTMATEWKDLPLWRLWGHFWTNLFQSQVSDSFLFTMRHKIHRETVQVSQVLESRVLTSKRKLSRNVLDWRILSEKPDNISFLAHKRGIRKTYCTLRWQRRWLNKQCQQWECALRWGHGFPFLNWLSRLKQWAVTHPVQETLTN